MYTDDVLWSMMMTLSLSRIVQLKLVSRQWCRIGRRVLTSNEWLYGMHVEDERDCFGTFAKICCLPNLQQMREAVKSQWNVLQLPCRVELSLEGSSCDQVSDFGILEDLIVDEHLRIVHIILSVDDQRFFSAEHIDRFYGDFTLGKYTDWNDEYKWDTYDDVCEWILQGIFPLVPDSCRVWLHPTYGPLQRHLDRSQPVLRPNGTSVFRSRRM